MRLGNPQRPGHPPTEGWPEDDKKECEVLSQNRSVSSAGSLDRVRRLIRMRRSNIDTLGELVFGRPLFRLAVGE